MAKINDSQRKNASAKAPGGPHPVKKLGPRPGAVAWSAPARKVGLPRRDPRRAR